MVAAVRYRILHHSEIAGKTDQSFGFHQDLVSASDVTGTDGASRPSPTNIAAALTNNNRHNSKAGSVIVLDSVANLDEKAVAVYS